MGHNCELDIGLICVMNGISGITAEGKIPDMSGIMCHIHKVKHHKCITILIFWHSY